MITINDINDIPADASHIKHNDDGSISIYFDDDAEIIEKRFKEAVGFKWHEINNHYKAEEKKLPVDKNTYYDLMAASIADVKYKGKDKAEVKKAFKDAVEARSALQDKRDTLLDQIQSATTIEEVNLIVW